MWMDVAQEIDQEQENRSDDEDTVYDRNSEEIPRRNPFSQFTEDHLEARRGMLVESDTRCGFATWRPEYLQQYVTKNMFVAVFIFTGILHGASWAYFTASISTMEKRMKFSSETSGALLAGNELAQSIISIVFSYYAIRARKMKFVTLGASLWALSAFILVSHQLFFGSGKYALSLTKLDEYLDQPKDVAFTDAPQIPSGTGVDDGLSQPVKVFPYINADRISSVSQLCMRDVEFIANSTKEECSISDSGSAFPISFVLFSQIISGIGTMLFLSSGGPYVEDIVMPNQLPIVFGITLSLRFMGPFLGYIMASEFLKTFISTVSTPLIEQHDPRWMGAWWLGWLVLGIFMTISAIVLGLFPRQMAREHLKQRSMTTDTGPVLLTLQASAIPVNSAELKIANRLPIPQNFTKTLMVFFSNNINLFISVSAILHIFVATGYWTFFPKYLEVVFEQSPARAAILTGSVSVVFNAAGLMLSGITISHFLPNSEKVALWNAMITVLQLVVLLIITQFGCESGNISLGQSMFETGVSTGNPTTVTIGSRLGPGPTTTEIILQALGDSDSTDFTDADLTDLTEITTFATTPFPTTTTRRSRPMVHLLSNCSVDCGCDTGPMIPMCDEGTGRVFYSPCHAGCQTVLGKNGHGTVFSDCSCISENSTLTQGFCQGHDSHCSAGFVTLLVLTALSQFLGATGVIGKMLIFYRSVAPEGRSFVISLGLLLISVFAVIPGPILFGTIIDSACHIWEHTCSGKIGHCWHYSNNILRYGFNLAAAGFLFLGGIFDVLVWMKVKVKDVRLYDGDIDHSAIPSTSGNEIYDGDGKSRASMATRNHNGKTNTSANS